MKFFWEVDYVYFHLVKYLDKNRTSISRVILNGSFSPKVRLAPVSPNRSNNFPPLLHKAGGEAVGDGWPVGGVGRIDYLCRVVSVRGRNNRKSPLLPRQSRACVLRFPFVCFAGRSAMSAGRPDFHADDNNNTINRPHKINIERTKVPICTSNISEK